MSRARKQLSLHCAPGGRRAPILNPLGRTMLCNSCRSLAHASRRETTAASVWREPRREPVRALLCPGCGTVLLLGGDAMLAKLAQLARFGLDSAGRPLGGAVRTVS